jgi:hypothetical protein
MAANGISLLISEETSPIKKMIKIQVPISDFLFITIKILIKDSLNTFQSSEQRTPCAGTRPSIRATSSRYSGPALIIDS